MEPPTIHTSHSLLFLHQLWLEAQTKRGGTESTEQTGTFNARLESEWIEEKQTK